MSLCQNGAPPMHLPWSNITVTTDQKAITRGIQLTLGTPPQIVALRPSTSDYNLYVANRVSCEPEFNATCIAGYGGVFDYTESSTFTQVTEAQWNGTKYPDDVTLSYVHFNDVLSFGNGTIYGYPAFFDEPGYGGQGALPLGWGSDFLELAVEQGLIPSTVFGLWTGSRSTSHPVDGSIVLGGYDTTRIKGELTTFDALEDCETCTTITDLVYSTEDGEFSLFSNDSEALQIHLQPADRVLEVPQNVWELFQEHSGGIYDDGYLTYAEANPPKGNLSVTLQNGYKTVIPTEELFYYPRGYNDEGRYDVINNTYQIGLLANRTNNGYVFSWGIPYLTMNYLIADYKRGEFKMAPAIRTDFSNQGGGYALKASCDPTTSTAVSTAVPSSSSTGTSSSESNGPSTGTIVGAAVGGILGLVAIAGGIGFFLWRRRRQQNTARNNAPYGTMYDPLANGGGGAATPAMSHQNTVSGRYSQWTGTSELGDTSAKGAGGGGPNVSVNQWLSSQDGDSQTAISDPYNSPNPDPRNAQQFSPFNSPMPSHHQSLVPPQYAKTDRPFEMPAQPWDTK
ncbi:hypothetical protein PV10_06080 [Exophiala mesophila]|uniref:Peptidase A1 domain-containing protein n=1 Tax=Exophiala mesophila TaxID=212818 RepID=A0A0D1ZA64_EXOME|nr:uncharacterized protein PV10_06080 [Exophiala mesophila]KIV91552.1 hypothetical protein PV10_06080 [Exophiala mesophila]